MKPLLIIFLNMVIALSTIEGNKPEGDAEAEVRSSVLWRGNLMELLRQDDVMRYQVMKCKAVGDKCKRNCDCCGATVSCESNRHECTRALNKGLQCWAKVKDCKMDPRPYCPGEPDPWAWKQYGPI